MTRQWIDDQIGQRFGHLVVLGRAPRHGNHGETMARVRCDCGTEKLVYPQNVKVGKTTSCGCEIPAARVRNATTHGHSKRPEWAIWHGMIARCTRPEHDSFADYGGRGIRVCNRWLNGDGERSGFECFLADIGPRPEGSSIERNDVNGHYEPSNCCWASAVAQANNTRRNVLIEFAGKRQTLAQWAAELGVVYGTLANRIRRGTPLAEALTPKTFKGRRRDLRGAPISPDQPQPETTTNG